MSGKLPINIDHPMRHHAIEVERIEYEAGWNPQSVLHTICIFANDFHNLGGGYLVFGIGEHDGRPVLPPRSIYICAINSIQKELFNLGHSDIHDKSLINNKKDQTTPQDTPLDAPQDVGLVSEHVEQLVVVLTSAMNRASIQTALELKDQHHILASYLKPAIKAGLIEMTLQDKPTSRRQRYRRTADGEALALRLKTRDAQT